MHISLSGPYKYCCVVFERDEMKLQAGLYLFLSWPSHRIQSPSCSARPERERDLGYKYETVDQLPACVALGLANWAWLNPEFLQTSFAPSEDSDRSQIRICVDNA